MEVQGSFNAQHFFNTLALIISNKENVIVTVKVTQEEKEEQQTTQALDNSKGQKI